MTFYTDIFKQSWDITRKHRTAWWFGFFLLFWVGKGMDMELLFSDARLLSDEFSPLNPAFWNLDYWTQTWSGFAHIEWIIFLGVCVLFCALLLLTVIMVSYIGLVDLFASARRKRSQQPYTLTHAIEKSRQVFWPVLWINVLSKGISLALLVLAALPQFMQLTRPAQFASSTLIFVGVIPFIIMLSIITKYAVNACVIKQLSVSESFRAGAAVFRANLGVSIELALFMFVAYFVVNVAAVVFAAIITSPFLLFNLFSDAASGAGLYSPIYFFLLYIAIVVCMVLSASVFSAWHAGNWTMLFTQLTKGQKKSKIYRLVHGE